MLIAITIAILSVYSLIALMLFCVLCMSAVSEQRCPYPALVKVVETARRPRGA